MNKECKKMIKLIRKYSEKNGISSVEQIAYIIATAKWETGHQCKPVKEAYYLSEEWRKKNLKYYPYYGRGYVQITWKENYAKFSKLFEIDFVSNPDLMLNKKWAIKTLIIGMRDGLFTGVSLNDCMNNDTKMDYIKARRIINGKNKAKTIAAIATKISKNILNKGKNNGSR